MPGVPGPSDPTLLAEPVLSALGFNDRWAAVFASLPADAVPMRVVRDDRGAVVAAGVSGDVRLSTPHHLHPVAGDWIAVADDQIVAVAQRSSAVVRPRPDGDPQILAANVDVVGVVHALDAPLNRRRLERGIVLAWESGATPLVLLTKADLCDDPDERARETASAGPGVDVVVVSVVDGRGLDDVRDVLQPNRTLALLGASGAGKSSLVNGLLGTDALATSAVRAGDAKGRHTTTHRELVVLPDGGVLIDTPGLRALSVGAVSVGLDRAFPEIEALAAQCRFRDCRHEAEPGCAIVAAVAEGSLSADHYEGWRRIRREADNARLRADPVAWRARSRQWGRVGREAMELKQGRDPHRRRT